jgi:hypothetical protein
MSGFDPSSIDWSDPIEANRQLKLQLARLEAAQGQGGDPATGAAAAAAAQPEAYEDSEGDYDYGDGKGGTGGAGGGYAARLDYDPRYIDEGQGGEYDEAGYDEGTQAAMDAYDQGHAQNYRARGGYLDEPPEAQRRRRGGGRARRKQKVGVKNEGKIRRAPQRSNMTFGTNKCRDIDRGNINLLQRLSSIHNRKTVAGGVPAKTRGSVTASGPKKRGSASINMRRKQDKIALENRKFAQRLQSVRGTKSLSKKNLRRHASRSKRFAELGREVPARNVSKRERQRLAREAREERESGWQ